MRLASIVPKSELSVEIWVAGSERSMTCSRSTSFTSSTRSSTDVAPGVTTVTAAVAVAAFDFPLGAGSDALALRARRGTR